MQPKNIEPSNWREVLVNSQLYFYKIQTWYNEVIWFQLTKCEGNVQAPCVEHISKKQVQKPCFELSGAKMKGVLPMRPISANPV